MGNTLSIYKRKVKLMLFLLFPGALRQHLKLQLNLCYRRYLAARQRIAIVDSETLLDWSKLDIKLNSPTTNAGQTSKLELLIIVGLAAQFIKQGDNFLEIGTFDGNTALNVAINLPSDSRVITIDLPEDSTSRTVHLEYDKFLVSSPARGKKKHLSQQNVVQIYQDSTQVDYKSLAFNGAFIDGAHDYATVKKDSLNVIAHIKRPGFLLWHDYDVENEVGDLLHELASQHNIQWIDGTRLAFLKLS